MLYVKTYPNVTQKWLPIMTYIHPLLSVLPRITACDCSYMKILKATHCKRGNFRVGGIFA